MPPLDIETTLNTVIDMMIDVFEGERGFIMLSDENKELKIMVARNMDRQSISEQDFSIKSMSVARKVYETGEAILSDNATLDTDITSPSILMNDIRGILCVPIRLKDSIMGVFYTDSRIKEGAFDNRKKR